MAIGTWTIMPKHQEDPRARGDPPDAMKKRSVKECPEAESQRFGIRYVGTMVDAEYDLFLYSLQSPVQSIETTS